jgi:hypothetical protein
MNPRRAILSKLHLILFAIIFSNFLVAFVTGMYNKGLNISNYKKKQWLGFLYGIFCFFAFMTLVFVAPLEWR